LTNLDVATSRVRDGITVAPVSKGSSIIRITKTAYSQQEAIDVVNNSLELLRDNELAEKNLIAEKTLDYIGKQIGIVKAKVDSASLEYQNLQKREKTYDFGGEKGEILSSIQSLAKQKIEQQERINALNSVSNNVYQAGSQGMIDLQIVGLHEGNFAAEVAKLRTLEIEKENQQLLYKPESREIQEIDNRIKEAKANIQHFISTSRNKINQELNVINQKLAEYEGKAYNLPEKEKEFLDAARGYTVNDALYNQLLSRYSQAELSIASNVSDVTIVDFAKYLGQGPISPDRRSNLMTALLIAITFPTLFLLIREVLDTKVKGIPDIVKVTNIPFLGVIGNNSDDTPLVVLNRPKSGISEAFRAIRSNLQFLFKNSQKDGNQTLLITSSIGGEGKTFVSMNISTALAVSGKKTLLIGMDLRKPRIFDEFGLTNKKGLSNYLSGDSSLDEVIQNTNVEYLDIITGGPIPPNPSELLLSDAINEMMRELKTKYDYIILDTPPVVLVADAFDLMRFADATLYVSRFN